MMEKSISELELTELRAQYSAGLSCCDDCCAKAEIIITPDPLFGTTPNHEAGWIGYYAAQCVDCYIPKAGGKAHGRENPITRDEHCAAMQNAVDDWNR